MIGKKFLPKSLFGRALLILVLPTVLIQLVVAFVFFDRHWDNILRHMSDSLAGEIILFTHEIMVLPPERLDHFVSDFQLSTGIDVEFEKRDTFNPKKASDDFPEFQDRLRHRLDLPFTVHKNFDGTMVDISIQLPDHTVKLHTTVKRLESRTIIILVFWMFGASTVFLLIAILFLRNQIRPIRKLAEAAENFGRGVDIPNFRPSGAAEVRQAARAFIIMRERIKRQLRTRTEMLAGISHDLRTPLTRMKLQLAMLGDEEAVHELSDDVLQMEHMIREYLDFARGEGREEAVRVSLREQVENVVSDYGRLGADVTLEKGGDAMMDIRISGFRRMLHNLVDNGLRYGKRCSLSLNVATNYCEVVVDDEGPGILPEQRDEVFKPFNRLEHSRNIKTGGVGLGLTIARDIALAHGGGIALDTSPKGGLRVIIRLPI